MNELILAMLVSEVVGKWVVAAGVLMGVIVAIGITHDVIVREARWPWSFIAGGLFLLAGLGIWALTLEWRN